MPLEKKGAATCFSDVGVMFGDIAGSGDQGRTSPDPEVLLFTSRRADNAHNVAVVEDVGFSEAHSTLSVDAVQNVLS